MDWHQIYQAYPVNNELTWLNNCGVVPAGKHIIEALSGFMEGYARKGILTEVATYPKVKANIESILSDLLNCSPDELCLIHNTAEGMNFISHGLHFSPQDEVVLLENEYPSNVYPWRHLEKIGVKLVTAPIKNAPDAFLEALKKLITERTRVISLSAVHWCTGMPLPLYRIGELCKKEGIVVCEKPGVEPDKILERLKENNIIAARRLGSVRFSPHVFISPGQLDEVIQVLTYIKSCISHREKDGHYHRYF